MSSKSSGKARAPPVTVEDDENLDDLDDVLEQFSKPLPLPTTKLGPHASTSSVTPTPSKPKHGPPLPPSMMDPLAGENLDDLGPDFAAELAAGMESLMKELAGSTAGVTVDPERERDMREAWEKLIISDLEGGPAGLLGKDLPEFKGASSGAGATSAAAAGKAGTSTPGAGNAADEAFQKTIREAMDRLKTSDDSLKADAASASDPLAQLLAQFGDVGGDLGEEGDDGDVKGLLENLMSQLMSKELLYEPLKELDDKYPEYFTKNASKLPSTELESYKKQHALVSQTVKIFEQPGYSDDDPKQSAEILKLMNEMQALGSPPAEIMGELPPGWALGADGMPNMAGGEGCVIA